MIYVITYFISLKHCASQYSYLALHEYFIVHVSAFLPYSGLLYIVNRTVMLLQADIL